MLGEKVFETLAQFGVRRDDCEAGGLFAQRRFLKKRFDPIQILVKFVTQIGRQKELEDNLLLFHLKMQGLADLTNIYFFINILLAILFTGGSIRRLTFKGVWPYRQSLVL